MTGHPFANAPLVGTCILRDGHGDPLERVVVVARAGVFYAVQVAQTDRGGVRVLEVPREDVEMFETTTTDNRKDSE